MDIPVHKFYTQIPGHLVREWGRGNTTNRLSGILAAARHLDELAEDVRGIIQPFVDVVQGADIFSFTNHENHRHDDRTMVEAARLAGVPHIFIASRRTSGGARCRRGADGTASALVVPSHFAGRFWRGARRVDGRGVVPPGFEAGPILRPETNSSRVRFGFVGRLAPQKSPGYL